MRTMTNRIRATAALAVAGLAFANAAEAVDLRDWGRKFPASERFVVLSQFSNQAVLDKETQLVWQAVPTLTTQTWSLAQLVCYNVAIGGRRGWRLPTFPELASVVGTDGVKPAALNGVSDGWYWAATEYPGVVGNAMLIYVPTGSLAAGPNTATSTNKSRFWCVRGPA